MARKSSSSSAPSSSPASKHSHTHVHHHATGHVTHGTRFTREAGIGCSIVDTDEGIQIVQITDGSPAQASGIVRGDYLEAVNKEQVLSKKVADVVSQIRGPFGTTVEISVRRGNKVINVGLVERGMLVSLAQLNSRLRDLEDCIHRLACDDAEKAKLKIILLGLSDANDLLIDQCNSLVQRAEEAEQHLNNDVHVEMKRLQDDLKRALARVAELEAELKLRSAQVTDLQNRNRVLEESDGHEKGRKSVLETELKHKSKQLERAEIQVAQLEELGQALKEQLANAMLTNSTKQTSFDKQLADLKSQIRDRDNRLAEMREKMVAIEKNPATVEAHRVRGEQFLSEGNWEAAIAEFSIALSKCLNGPCLDGRATAYANLGRWDECLADCLNCLTFEGGDRPSVRLRAVAAFLHLGQSGEAWDMFDSVENCTDHVGFEGDLARISAAVATRLGEPETAKKRHTSSNLAFLLLCWARALALIHRWHTALAFVTIAADATTDLSDATCRAAIARDSSYYQNQILSVQHTPLHECAKYEDTQAALVCLFGLNLDVNTRNEGGETVLHISTLSNSSESLHFLQSMIANNADVNASDKNGNAPLHCVVKSDAVSAAGFLLANHANINAKNSAGMTALHVSIQAHCNVMTQWFIQHSADVHLPNNMHNTPLHTAVTLDNLSVAGWLIEAGSDTNACGCDGWRPIHLTKSIPMAQTLISKNADVHLTTKYGSTPLHLAVYNGDKQLANLLIESGAHVNSPNTWQDSPLRVASAKGDRGMSQLLVQHGAVLTASPTSSHSPLNPRRLVDSTAN